MRRSTRRRFETYRKQTRTLTFGDEARDETMRIIRALRAEQAQREAAAAEAPAVAPMAEKTALPAPKPKKRPSWIGMRAPFALRAAACAVVAVGVALFAVAALPVFEAATHTTERAIAGEPLRPYSRIELSDPFFTDLGLEPPFDSDPQYDPQGQYYGCLEARLFLPGISEKQCEISILDAPDVRVCNEDIFTADLSIPAEQTSCVASRDNDYLFSLVWPLEMTREKFAAVFGDHDYFYPTEPEAAEFVDSLRNARIVVKTSSDIEVYRLEYNKLPDEESIQSAFRHLSIRPVMLTLVKESE